MNYFKFHSVGQGLFYTGSLAHRTYNFVYDCGTENKKFYINDAVDSYIRSISTDPAVRPEIAFVVISHLHRDHFSGLYNLAQKAEIRRVFLPYLGKNKNLVTLILANAVFGDGDREDDGDDRRLFYFMCNLYGVEENNNFPRIDVTFLGFEQEKWNVDGYCYSNEKIDFSVGNNTYWQFVLLNRRILDSKINELNRRIDNLLACYDVNRVIDLINKGNHMRSIAEIYKIVFRDEIRKDSNYLNITSTVMVHFPMYKNPKMFYIDDNRIVRSIKENIEAEYWYDRYWYDLGYNATVGLGNSTSLLTGDAMLDSEMCKSIVCYLTKRHNTELYGCGIVQVPHHGAEDNWNVLQTQFDLYKIRPSVYIISAGIGNKYKHPHINTIDDLKSKRLDVKLVNQLNDFEYYVN